MAEILLQATDLAKAYGANRLFSGVNLSIEAGKCVAFVGHNGTGKTTLLKILAGLVQPSAGTVKTKQGTTFAYVPEHFSRLPMTAARYLRHMGTISGLSGEEAARRSAALMAVFYMDSMADTPMRHLSKGTLQKVGVIQALLDPPDVLLLDEPLSGQDIDSQQVFLRQMEQRKQAGCAVLLSCHEPYLVNRLADAACEIAEKQVRQLSLEDRRFMEYDMLAFACDGMDQGVPGPLATYEVETDGQALRALVPADCSNDVVAEMLAQGYRLKEFRHANGF